MAIEILSPSNEAEIWQNVWSYVSIPQRAGNFGAAHCGDPRRILHRLADGSWPDDPLTIAPDDAVRLESIDFTGPLAAFYRTAS